MLTVMLLNVFFCRLASVRFAHCLCFNTLILKFFGGGKRDHVASRVVVQPRSLAGFSVAEFFSLKFRLCILVDSSVFCLPFFVGSFMLFWFSSVLGFPSHYVSSAPCAFDLETSSFLSFSCFFSGCMQGFVSGLWLWCWFLHSFLFC